jgi:hypothetical protein
MIAIFLLIEYTVVALEGQETRISCVSKTHSFLEQFQQFDKSIWHLSNFAKTRKIGLQQFGKPTWQK